MYLVDCIQFNKWYRIIFINGINILYFTILQACAKIITYNSVFYKLSETVSPSFNQGTPEVLTGN